MASALFKVIGFYSLCLAVLGTMCNLMVFLVAFRLRHNPTFVFIAFLAIVDSLTLYIWNLDHFIGSFFGLDIEYDSLVGCKLGNFLQYVTLKSSSWLLVALSFDRYLQIRVQNWRKLYFGPSRAFIACICILVLLCLVDLNIFFTFGYYETAPNATFTNACFSSYNPNLRWMVIWSYVSFISS